MKVAIVGDSLEIKRKLVIQKIIEGKLNIDIEDISLEYLQNEIVEERQFPKLNYQPLEF